MARRVDIQKKSAGRAIITTFDSASPTKKNVKVPGTCELRIDEGNPGTMIIQPLSSSRQDAISVQFNEVVTNLGATNIEEYLIALADANYFL